MAYSITVEEVANRLGKARPAEGGGWYCRCPAHDDDKPSLWIAQREGGGLHVKCHAGCSYENVAHTLRSMNLWPQPGARKNPKSDEVKRHRDDADIAEIVVPVPPDAPEIDWSHFRRAPPTILYEYRKPSGDLTGFVARWDNLTEGKTIRPVSLARLKNGRLIWVLKAPPAPHDLYRVAELSARPEAPVLITEGEKAADAAARLLPDHVCVTWRSGASSASKTDFAPLRGRHIVLWPDADEAGRKAMDEVATLADQAGAVSVRCIALPSDLPKGWDLADMPPDGFDIRSAVAEATAMGTFEGDEALDAPPDSRLVSFIIKACDLLEMELPQREWLVDRLLSTSSLTMVYAERGLGKTWFVISLAASIVKGENFLDYEVTRPWRVLYVDGEMSLVDLQSRIRALEPRIPELLLLLPSERLFREAKPLNLHDAEDQSALISALNELSDAGMRPDLIIFDNLSSLSGGIDENDNSALDGLLRWLVKLKHEGFAVLLVHHAGKSGAQRGASRREDLLDTSIALKAPGEDDEPHDGASFTMSFPKTRGPKPKPPMLEMRLTERQGQLGWAYNEPRKADRATEILRLIWQHKPKTQKDLAQIAELSPGAISGHCKKLRKAGFIEIEELKLTTSGRDELVAIFPELEAQMLRQGDLLTSNVI